MGSAAADPRRGTRHRRARRLWFDGGPLPYDHPVVAVRLFEIVQTGSLDTVVKRLTGYVAELTGIVGPIIVLIDPHTQSPTFAGGVDVAYPILAAVEEARRKGATMTLWQAYTKNRIVVERNWARRAMTDPKLVSVSPYAAGGPEHGLEDLVALPLRWDGPPIGVVVGMIPTGLQHSHLVRWRQVAFETALALRYCVAIQEARHTGSEHERLRMREELHESVSQRLFAASLLAGRTESDARGTALLPQLEELRQLLGEASSALRSLIAEPQQNTDNKPLSYRLATLVPEFADPGGLNIHLDADPGWDDLSRECADDVIRIVRECLRNVVKHARATAVWVRLPAAADGMLLIEVADDGAGFDPQDVGQTSFGLSLITERATERSGRCDVQVDGRGTTMRVRLVPEFESDWQLARRALARSLPG